MNTMNKTWHISLPSRYLPKEDHTYRVVVDVELREEQREVLTTQHTKVHSYHKLYFVGTVMAHRGKRGGFGYAGGGQCQDQIARIYARPEVQKLVELWQRWHLNDLRPDCECMQAEQVLTSEGLMTVKEARKCGLLTHDLSKDVTCPKTGYRFGQEWLVDIIPDDALELIVKFLDHLSETYKGAH